MPFALCQAEELGNDTRELKGLIDDSESIIFINLDRYTHIHSHTDFILTLSACILAASDVHSSFIVVVSVGVGVTSRHG